MGHVEPVTNAPDSRKTHVIRIVGTNKNGDVLQDIWADVERFEVAKSATQSTDGLTNGSWLGNQRKLQWQDDPTANDYLPDGNAARNPSDDDIIKVCSPDEADVNDPEKWIPVRRIRSLKSKGGVTSDQGYQDRQVNDGTVESRKVTVRRIVHYDTNIDADAQAAFDGDANLKAYVVRGTDYTKKDGTDGGDTTKDDSQWVEHEIVQFFKPRANVRNDDASQVNQGVQVNLKNQYQIDESDEPDGKVVGNNGINPPYRLDPWQNIINVKLTSPEEVMVAWGDGLYAHSTSSKNTTDGIIYQDKFGSNVTTAASGLGVTVVSKAPDMVVFGKPRDGVALDQPAPCFMRITPGSFGHGSKNIQRGVLDGRGGISWSTIKSVDEDSGCVAISFAGGAFFVVANDADSKSFLYVSFDGLTWNKVTTANEPNNGEDGQNGSPSGDHVAYNPTTKVYCHTGWFLRGYQYDLVDIDDGTHHPTHATSVNFWSAISIDGLHWTPKYDMQQPFGGADGPSWSSGAPASPGDTYNSVACGNGVFVAATSWVVRYDYFNFGGALNVNRQVFNRIDVAGSAVSDDGKNWTNKQLPGSEWDPGVFIFDIHGSGVNNRTALQGLVNGVIFCKTSTEVVDPNTGQNYKGFFLLSATEISTGNDVNNSIYHKKRWKSYDGREWKLVYRSDDKSEKIDNALSVHNKNPGKIIST